MSQFLGFLGGGAGVKYLDTQLTGNIKITFELAPANNVLFRASAASFSGAATPIAGTNDDGGARGGSRPGAGRPSSNMPQINLYFNTGGREVLYNQTQPHPYNPGSSIQAEILSIVGSDYLPPVGTIIEIVNADVMLITGNVVNITALQEM